MLGGTQTEQLAVLMGHEQHDSSALVVAVVGQADIISPVDIVHEVYLSEGRRAQPLAVDGQLPGRVRVPTLPEQGLGATVPRLVVCGVPQKIPARESTDSNDRPHTRSRELRGLAFLVGSEHKLNVQDKCLG